MESVQLIEIYKGLSTWTKVPLTLIGCMSLKGLLGWLLRKLQKRPPQPFALPMLGNLYLLPQPGELPGVHKAMTNLSKKHGPVMGFWFGSVYTVVLSNWEAAHEALKTRGQDFAGRFCPGSIEILTKGRGIALQNNLNSWKKARTLLLQGMTKKVLGAQQAPIALEEIHSTGKEWYDLCLKNPSGSSQQMVRGIIGRESLNVYMRQMCNLRFSNELTPTFQDVRACLENIFQRISAGNPADYMPLLKLMGRPKILDEMDYWTTKMYGYIKKWISEHKKTLVKENPRDFLDEMLIRQAEAGLTDLDVEVIVWDVMAGGIDTTATTLEWLIYILCNYPETQRKMHEELERVIGPNRLPTYEDRDKLPYINAVILELMRWKHFAPFGLPHMTLKDTQCLGYSIPAGTQVLINYHTMGLDPKAWVRPEEWRPERWQNEEKQYDRAFIDGDVKTDDKSYKYIPFGAGPRMCVGWGLGRVVLWCKVATHLHCFKFESASGQKLNIDDENFGVTIVPPEQKVKITPRPAAKLLKSIEKSFTGTTL